MNVYVVVYVIARYIAHPPVTTKMGWYSVAMIISGKRKKNLFHLLLIFQKTIPIYRTSNIGCFSYSFVIDYLNVYV